LAIIIVHNIFDMEHNYKKTHHIPHFQGSFVGPNENLFCNDDGCPNILGGPAAAKSAVEEAPALENPNSSLDMTTGVAWGIVTATMMLFIMG
jgi:hypothetical protein